MILRQHFINPACLRLICNTRNECTTMKWMSVLTRRVTTTVKTQQLSRFPACSTRQNTDGRLILQPDHNAQLWFARNAHFLSRVGASKLWKGVTSVSPAGKKKGRAKRAAKWKNINLNKGQTMGQGRVNILWPGFTIPVMRGKLVEKITKLSPKPNFEEDKVKYREDKIQMQRKTMPALLRGWSGASIPGQSMGPPDPIGDYKFEGFESRVLAYHTVSNMTGTLGRKHSYFAFVVVGNKNGLAGFGKGKAQSGRAALKQAKNKAAQYLMYVPRFEDHTVYHNMYTKFHRSRVFIQKKEKGYGLVCHRALKTICEVAGIKDLHCMVEGSTKNIPVITRAFFNALVNQETHQELADRMKLHLVEMRPERDNLPVVVASPQEGEVSTERYFDEEEDIDGTFNRLYYEGKVYYTGQRYKPPKCDKLKSYKKKCAFDHRNRNQREAQITRLAGLW